MLDFEKLQIDPNFFYHAVTSSSNDYLYVWDFQQDIVYAPQIELFSDLQGGSAGVNSAQWLERIHENDMQRMRKNFHELLSGESCALNFVFQMRVASGEYLWVRNKGVIKRDETTRTPLLIIGTVQILENKVNLDAITGLMGRESCAKIFDDIQEENPAATGSILLLGIDEFAHINTLNNHLFGDLVLRTTVQDIELLLPNAAMLFRFDGDQFVILGNGMTEKELLAIYEKIKKYTSNAHEANGYSYRFTISAGLASYPKDGADWPSLEKRVSIALKNAKEFGKNRCVVFQKNMLEEKIHTQSLSNLLADSIENNFQGFQVAYQPVCTAKSLDVKGAEALLRFTTPEGVSVSPLEFIPLLENSGLIVPVGLWVAEQAIKACKKWVSYHPIFTMNVNVSYIQLRDSSFCANIEDVLKRECLDAKHLVLELTESYFISAESNVDASLRYLQDINIRVAMDDFGTGYSSLARLSQFNVDLIKIDRIFVQAIHKTKFNYDFIEAVVRLCHSVGMSVCLEGIETAEEHISVCALEADFIQGFYVSKAVSEDDFFLSFIDAVMHESLG